MLGDRNSILDSYARSITSKAWTFTPYEIGTADDNRSEWEDRVLSNAELKNILEEEQNLPNIPGWALEIVDRQISALPPCGHYTFPRPLIEVIDAIKSEKCPDFVISCYTSDSKRKKLMSYYIFCLDAWLKGASAEVVLTELVMRDNFGKDWQTIVSNIYETLGELSEEKSLVIRRLVHRLRWWIKTLTWFDDKRDRFILDVYSGDIRGDTDWGYYGNHPYADPYFAEMRLPEVQELTYLIKERVPEGEGFAISSEQNWLCGPKAFRYLEKLIIRIGNIDKDKKMDTSGSILQCEDTYPDIKSFNKRYGSIMLSLEECLKKTDDRSSNSGETMLVKHWLFRILRFRLQLLEQYGTIGKLTGVQETGKSGEGKI